MVNKISQSDLIYALSLSLDKIGLQMLKALYKKDPEQFIYYLHQHFNLEYINSIYKKIGIKPFCFFYTREEIDNCFGDWALLFHKNINRKFLKIIFLVLV